MTMNQEFKNAYYNIADIVALSDLQVSDEFNEEVQKLRKQLYKIQKIYETEVSEDWD